MQTNVVILSQSTITSEGVFIYKKITSNQARILIEKACENSRLFSFVGHRSTANLLTKLFNTKIEFNRMEYKQKVGDKCIIFKLKRRPLEGEVLTEKQLNKIGYSFGLLTMKKITKRVKYSDEL